jgi:hypothetical protein
LNRLAISNTFNHFVYCSKTRPSIGKVSSASQQPNSRKNDINLQTAADFFAARCAKGKFCDGFLNQQKQGLRSCKSQLQNERPSPQKPITPRSLIFKGFLLA